MNSAAADDYDADHDDKDDDYGLGIESLQMARMDRVGGYWFK